MFRSGQFHKLLFVANTTRVRRYDVMYRIDVEPKYDHCTLYFRLVPRIFPLLTPDVDFDSMPQGSWNVLAMVEDPVECVQGHNFWSKSLQIMFYTVFRIRKSPPIDFTTQNHDNRWNKTVIDEF